MHIFEGYSTVKTTNLIIIARICPVWSTIFKSICLISKTTFIKNVQGSVSTATIFLLPDKKYNIGPQY